MPLLSVEPLLLLAPGLRIDRERRRRSRDQSSDADRLARLLAIPVAAFFDTAQGFVDLLEQLPLAVARAQLERVLLLDRRLVGWIGFELVLSQMLGGEIRLLEQFLLGFEQPVAEERELLRVHVLRSGRAHQFGFGQPALFRRFLLRVLPCFCGLYLRRPGFHRLRGFRRRLLYCFSTKHCSSPLIKRSCGRFFPMKTIVLERFSSLPQGRPRSPPMSMCTP